METIDRAFPWLEINDLARDRLSTDDARDALVCALIARGRALGITEGPSDGGQAGREGWIHVLRTDRRYLLDPQRTASWLKATLRVPSPQDLDEDWPKRTFDFPRGDGTHADSLPEYADALGIGVDSAAEQLVNYSFPDTVPTRLMREAWSQLSR